MGNIRPDSDSPSQRPLWRIEATLVSKLNLADFQNAVPILRELSLVNDASEPAQGLELRIESAPPFLQPKAWRIDEVEAGGRYHLTELDVSLIALTFPARVTGLRVFVGKLKKLFNQDQLWNKK